MKKLYVILYAMSLISDITYSASAVRPPSIHMKKELASLFEYAGTWRRNAAGTSANIPAGWLTVHDEKGKVLGKVLVRLDGASFINPNIANDYKITYVGFEENGMQLDLPRGLYYWKENTQTKRNPYIGPAQRNKYFGYDFIYNIDGLANPTRLWCTRVKHKKIVCWDEKKEKYLHPSFEIDKALQAK